MNECSIFHVLRLVSLESEFISKYNKLSWRLSGKKSVSRDFFILLFENIILHSKEMTIVKPYLFISYKTRWVYNVTELSKLMEAFQWSTKLICTLVVYIGTWCSYLGCFLRPSAYITMFFWKAFNKGLPSMRLSYSFGWLLAPPCGHITIATYCQYPSLD